MKKNIRIFNWKQTIKRFALLLTTVATISTAMIPVCFAEAVSNEAPSAKASITQATGIGVIDKGNCLSTPVLARQAAIIDARRNLFEMIQGVSVKKVAKGTIISESFNSDDKISQMIVSAIIDKAQVIAEESNPDGYYHVTMSLPEEANDLLFQVYYQTGIIYAKHPLMKFVTAIKNKDVTEDTLTFSLNAEAIDCFSQAIKLKSDSAETYYKRGCMYAQPCIIMRHSNMEIAAGNPNLKKALADFSRAIELKDDFAEAYMYRGVLYGEMGQNEKSASDLAKAKQLSGGQLPDFDILKP